MESIAHEYFCSPETYHMLPTNMKFCLKRNSQETNQNHQAHKAIIVQGGNTSHLPIMVPMAKQLLKISSQVSVLRTMTLHFWMLAATNLSSFFLQAVSRLCLRNHDLLYVVTVIALPCRLNLLLLLLLLQHL